MEKEFFDKLEAVMMVENWKGWAIVTPNEIKKDKIFGFIKERMKSWIVYESRNELRLKNGTHVDWIDPDKYGYRMPRFKWMFIDRECIKYKPYEVFYRQVASPSNVKSMGDRIIYF